MVFERVRQHHLQKGIAGTVVEQCVFGYDPDSSQEPDLVIIDGEERIYTELKTTGIKIVNSPQEHFVAKEPMSITGVGVYDLANQEFETSHFWKKLEHLLFVYYHYSATGHIEPYEYKDFPVVGFEFFEFSKDDIAVLREDWEQVKQLCAEVVSHHEGKHDTQWREAVKQEYIEVHGRLRRVLSYIDLAPMFPPRFRLKKTTVSNIVSRHFGYKLEQLPGRYSNISDIDKKCHELTIRYRGKTIKELAEDFSFQYNSDNMNKSITEWITVAMFGGTSKKMNKIDLFSRFGLIGKSVVMTATDSRTEDMKLYHIDFDEMIQTDKYDENGLRKFVFEDSDLYSYFADHELLCIIFKEPPRKYNTDKNGKRILLKNKLEENVFVGFKRLVFSDEFINNNVRRAWEDTRKKIFEHTLIDVVSLNADGTVKTNKDGSKSSAPNFIKSSQNEVFIRGSAPDSSIRNKTESVNGISMIPQYVWIKGKYVVDELEKTPEL